MGKVHKIFCTLGPSSLNKRFLKHAEINKIALVRLNLSHLNIKKFEENIKFIKKNSSLSICVDTEGAQIRTKYNSNKKKFFSKNSLGVIHSKDKKKFCLYPPEVFKKIKTKDILDIGFEGLKIKIYKKKK